MSHRTQELEPLRGLPRIVRELRYHEAARQFFAVLLMLIYALTASPTVVWAAAGIAIALVGMVIRLYASGYIVKNRELATSGPYALVRHPLYTGNILLIIGFSLANVSYWAVPLALAFFWFYYPTAIEYEDRKLRKLFGERWDHWARTTPALMPSFERWRELSGGGGWSFAKSLRRNGELFIAIIVLVCVYLTLRPLL
jgi:protein-S-isoprenylcysteine O-methyltransferase Ste14